MKNNLVKLHQVVSLAVPTGIEPAYLVKRCLKPKDHAYSLDLLYSFFLNEYRDLLIYDHLPVIQEDIVSFLGEFHHLVGKAG